LLQAEVLEEIQIPQIVTVVLEAAVLVDTELQLGIP
jgi:hypothetical protein